MIEPLESGAGISLDGARKHLQAVRTEFDRVKKNYSGLLSRFKRNLHEEDHKVLANCIGVLLPLNLETSVQEEMREISSMGDTVWYQAAELQREILTYSARFKNSGVTILEDPMPF